ncbi:hypothetical protein A2W14_02880, partial [Candidatus Gottesmanbacteria bacterium RBG_16_37_8]
MKNFISSTAIIGKGVDFGFNVVIGDKAKIGNNSILRNNIVIYEGTEIGKSCLIEDGAVLGKPTNNSKAITRKVDSKPAPLIIGNSTIIGTHVIIFKGTMIGNDCLIGDGANIREGCQIGNKTLISRGVTINYNTRVGNNCKILDLTHLTGEMVIEDDVFISTHVVSSNDNSMGRNRVL